MTDAAATRFAIAVICQDDASRLGRTLDSLRAQSHSGWQAVLIDLGSQDDTALMIEQAVASDPRFSAMRFAGMGRDAARGQFGSWASGDVTAWCEPGDVLPSDRLERMARELAAGQIGGADGTPLRLSRSAGDMPAAFPAAGLCCPRCGAELSLGSGGAVEHAGAGDAPLLLTDPVVRGRTVKADPVIGSGLGRVVSAIWSRFGGVRA